MANPTVDPRFITLPMDPPFIGPPDTFGGGPPLIGPPAAGSPSRLGAAVESRTGYTGDITPPTDIARAASNLSEIFAPAASQPTSRVSSTPNVGTGESLDVGTPLQPLVQDPLGPTGSGPTPSAQGSQGGGGGGGNINSWIKQLMNRFLNDGGMGDELRMDLRNQAQQTGKLRERDRIMRRADDFAGRGLFGSGLSHQATSAIEREESANTQAALNEIEFQNAQMEAQSLRDAIGALQAQIQWKLGRGQLNVQREQLALQKLMHAENLALQQAKFKWQQLQDQANNPFAGMTDEEIAALLGGGGGGGFNPADIPTWYPDQYRDDDRLRDRQF